MNFNDALKYTSENTVANTMNTWTWTHLPHYINMIPAMSICFAYIENERERERYAPLLVNKAIKNGGKGCAVFSPLQIVKTQ